MFSSGGRRLFRNGVRSGRIFFSTGTPKNLSFSSGYFDDRTLGLLALLVTVPTAAYIWKHHKGSKIENNESFSSGDSNLLIENSPLKNRKVQYLIIGGGAAGFSAIQAIKEEDPESQIVLVSKEQSEPYLRPPLSKELWFSSHEQLGTDPKRLSFVDWHGNRKPLAFENEKFYKESGIETILGAEAIDFDLENRKVELSDGQILQFDSLLIATGADPKILDAPIEESIKDRVKTFRNVSDFVNLYKFLKESDGKRIVVIGGGFLGSELTVAVSKIGQEKGHSVTQIFPESGHMALVFPKYLSNWTTEKITSLGVQVKSNRTVKAIQSNNPDDPSAIRLTLDNGEELTTDHVVVAVGVEPALMKSFKRNLPIDKEFGGLEADKFLQVSTCVFAAGDVVSYINPVLGHRCRTEHFDHAILSGKLAGRNMVRSLKNLESKPLESYSDQSMFWSDLGPEVGFEAVGLIDSSLTTVGVWARARPIESPRGTEFDSSDIRVQTIGQTSITTVEPKLNEFQESEAQQDQPLMSTGPVEIEKEIVQNVPEIISESETSTEISPSYGKGVVFYLKDKKIVGILLFNLFNRVNLAKELLKEGRGVNDIGRSVRLFNVDEVA